ncbi:Copia protein, partial [Mucuna pruriens]
MDVTFHETQLFFVSSPLQGGSYLEVEPVIESLPFPTQDFIESLLDPTQDVQVQVQEVMEPILVPKQVSIPKNPIVDVTDDLLNALKKGKQSCVKWLVEIYTDAVYAGSIVDTRFNSKYCKFLGGNLVTWRRKKQNVVVQSSIEAEFRAKEHDICEGFRMKIILDNLKDKDIEIDRHFIKEKLNSGLVITTHVPIGFQVVDIFTKGLPTTRFQELNG